MTYVGNRTINMTLVMLFLVGNKTENALVTGEQIKINIGVKSQGSQKVI